MSTLPRFDVSSAGPGLQFGRDEVGPKRGSERLVSGFGATLPALPSPSRPNSLATRQSHTVWPRLVCNICLTMEIHAVSFPDYHASRQTLRFPPPMAAVSVAPDRFDFAWKLLQYCFDFPDPATAHATGHQPTENDRLVLGRFVAKATSLAASPFLAYPSAMTVNLTGDGEDQIEEIEKNFPNEESERGFMALLRQFAHDSEPASFKCVQQIAVLHDSKFGEPNGELLRAWGKYHKKLLTRSPVGWGYVKALEGRPMSEIPRAHDPRVDQLLRTYFYGDIIHFGEGRDELQRLSADAFSDAHHRMSLYEGASGLAMYYMGYATVLQGIFDL